MQVSKIFVGIAAALQFYFMVLEMFFWTKPLGRRVFGLKKEFADESRALAMNQGLYNGFLAAGLTWSLVHSDPRAYYQISLFFCACMFLAGILGGLTASWKIILVQALPAALAAAAVFFYF